MDNIAKINKIIKILESDNINNSLEQVLEKYEWPAEIFFITLVSQIINELTNLENKVREKDFNYNPSFLYKMINLFCNVKYHHAITKEILDYIITKENIDLIFDKLIIINNYQNSENEKEIFIDFNNHIVNLLITIMNFNNKEIIDIIVNNKNSDKLLNNLFNIFSQNEYCRNFLYNLEKNFCLYYPNVKSFKQNINYTIFILIKYVDDDINNYFKIKEEINIILLIYKNDIEIIEDLISILLMNIFKEFENKDDNNFNNYISSLFKTCFNNIVFINDKNNKDIKNEYNLKFINFLFSLYKEMVKNKLKKSYTLLFSHLFLSIGQNQIGAKKYKWLIKNTNFKTLLQSIIDLKEENLLTIYYTKIMTITAQNNSKNKDDYYVAEEDIYFFLKNLKSLIKEDNQNNMNIVNIIFSMIINLININKSIINSLLNKYKIFDILIPLINCKNYEDKIRNNLIDLMEEILKKNNFNYKFGIKINFSKEINDINKRLYIIYLLYENNIKNFEQKISEIIENMLLNLKQNNFGNFFFYIDIIKNYIINCKTNNLKAMNYEIISKLNYIFIHSSQVIIENEIKNIFIDAQGTDYNIIKKKIIENLINIIYELNMNDFNNKLNKNKIIGKNLFLENTIYLVIKNLLTRNSRKEILDFIIYNICLERDIEDNSKNNDIKENNQNENKFYYLLKSSKIIYIICVILLENRDEEIISLFYSKLEEIIDYSEINIKILLNVDIVSVIIRTIFEIRNKETIKKLKLILNKISIYLDEKSLIKYISNLYFISYDALINDEKNKEKKQEILNLFNILKFGIGISKNFCCNYFTISNKKLSNPYIYNLFYITGLYKKNKIINYNIELRIKNNIENFNLVKFINENNFYYLSFILDKNKLIISENSNKKEKTIIKSFDNINNYLKSDSNFHNISIILNLSSLTINIIIDSNELTSEDNNKIMMTNSFLFQNFDIMIGYDLNNKTIQNNNSKLSMIDIANILILNYDNEEDNDLIKKQKANNFKKYDLLDSFIKDKNRVIGEFITAEFNLKNNNINFINSEKVKELNSYIFHNCIIENNDNKYIGYINFKNPFINKEFNNSNNDIYVFLISSNYNIEEYYSLNNIIDENNISKNIMKSLISKGFGILDNVNTNFFVDFLIGFLYLFDKETKYLLNKITSKEENDIIDNENKEQLNNENNKQQNIDDEKEIIKNNFINSFVLSIFEIICEFQNKNILNYFLYENNIINIKIKYFFEKNIHIINNKELVEKLLNILKMTKLSDILDTENNSYQEYLLNIITNIFFDLTIFKKLENEIKNFIILKLYSSLNIISSKNNNNINRILYELLINLYNIILFHELSTEAINKENNKNQLDIIIECIKKIYNIFEGEYKFLVLENNDTYCQKITEHNENIINLYNELESNLQTHNVHQFVEENKNILSDNFLENNIIQNQISKLYRLIINLNNDFENQRYNSTALIRTDNINLNLNANLDNNGNKINQKCSFCLYLNIYFNIFFNFIYDSIKYDKYYKKFFRNLFLNFKEFRSIIQSENDIFVWFLSSKESSFRIQNKFFLKENDIKVIKKLRANKSVYNTYLYQYDTKQYKYLIKNFHQLFIYDNISKDSHFISNFYNNLNSKNNINNDFSDSIVNCLYVKRIFRTLSLALLSKEYMIIFNNIFIDLNEQLHVVKDEIDKEIICLENEIFKDHFNNFIKTNNNDIISEIFNDQDNNNNNNKKFGLDKNYKFSIKKIEYKKISEMYKVSHLQISNAIEIMMTNGENHFLIFLSGQRDKIFNKILKNISISSESNKKHHKSASFFTGSSKSVNKISNSFYMKYCPTNYIIEHEKEIINLQKNSLEKSKGKSNSKDSINISQSQQYAKSLIDLNSFINEIKDLWAKNKISNYDYLMALNCLSGRSLNDLTQYYIFPWVIKNIDHNILNWFSSSLYRNLSLPLFACELNLSDLKKKYDLQDQEDKCHTGTFYSTSAFVCYFLTRQRPFTEIHLEIQGGEFDCPDRLFIGTRELSVLSEKYQELIPALYNLPESYINTNNFKFGKMQKRKIEVKDFDLPIWSKEDPRKFVLILRKLLESEKVNEKLNLWIDLIFGFKQNGPEAIKSCNLFRKACYESTQEEIEEKIQSREIVGYLYEKQELGYTPKQIFKNSHKKKENLEPYIEKKNNFFDDNRKLMKMKFEQIKNQNYENNKSKIKFKKIKDIFIFYKKFYKELFLNPTFKGGISSLKSIMDSLNNITKKNYFKKNPKKVMKKLSNEENKESSFLILGKNCQFLGKNIDIVIKFYKKYIQIIDIKNFIYSCYFLNEISNISSLITNEKGNRIYIGFENGSIFEYKIINAPKNNQKILYPFMYLIKTNVESLIKENIFDLNFFYTEGGQNNNDNQNSNNYNTIILQKISENNFSLNNPHFPEEIVTIKLNEEHNLLIASTIKNLIYIISTNTVFKLMHIIDYLYEYPKKIKDIIPLSFNGDFIVYTSLNVYLFNINGVPLCELNLLNKEYNNLSKIKYVTACFIYDVILFTAHDNGYITIWKVKNKNVMDNYNERISYVFNKNITKSFLSEYNYAYDLYYYENNHLIDFSNKKIRNEYELKRKFDIVSQIKINDKLNKPIIFMKMSTDMNYMIILDEEMNIFLLSNFDDYIDNNTGEKRISIKKKEKKQHICTWCKNVINNESFRTTKIMSLSNYEINELNIETDYIKMRNNTDEIHNNIEIDNIKINNNNINDNKENKGTFLCELCKQKLIHTENYLYNY